MGDKAFIRSSSGFTRSFNWRPYGVAGGGQPPPDGAPRVDPPTSGCARHRGPVKGGHRMRTTEPSICATCEIEIAGEPTIHDASPFCCADCAAGRPCTCANDSRWSDPQVRHCLDIQGALEDDCAGPVHGVLSVGPAVGRGSRAAMRRRTVGTSATNTSRRVRPSR